MAIAAAQAAAMRPAAITHKRIIHSVEVFMASPIKNGMIISPTLAKKMIAVYEGQDGR
jgi:hypothetical protein